MSTSSEFDNFGTVPVAPATPAKPRKVISYTVKTGDTMQGILAHLGGDVVIKSLTSASVSQNVPHVTTVVFQPGVVLNVSVPG